jgi:3-phosphoshikimate 1-carboxyvinyltransferase
MQIIGASRLRIKESDRLASVKALMDALDCPCEVTEDGLLIAPHAPQTAPGKTPADPAASPNGDCRFVDGMNDHRIVMAAAIAATACDRPVRIKGCDAVNKSWPLFFDAFASLGNRVSFS